MTKKKSKKEYIMAQAATELAIFGAILIFIVGTIIRTSFSSGQQQNLAYKAMRMAMKTSYEYSMGIKGLGGGDGSASRNSASILLVEDRLSPGSAKYGETDRTPYVLQSAAMHTRNLFLPVDPGETYNLPVFDLFVNDKHFPLMTQNFKVVPITEAVDFYQKIPNKAGFEYDPNCAECFDLDLNGTVDGDEPTSQAERDLFSWQWKKIPIIRLETTDFFGTVVVTHELADGFSLARGDDVDVDGDLEEESFMEFTKGSVTIQTDLIDVQDPFSGEMVKEAVFRKIENIVSVLVIDGNEGDVDFGVSSTEIANGAVQPGFTRDISMYTRTKDGTYLLIQEGDLYSLDKQYVRTTQKKDSVDVISRLFQLTNNTGRFCTTDPTPLRQLEVDGEPNPVEVCCRSVVDSDTGLDSACCFQLANVDKTCLDTGPANPRLFIRSRIEDRHGRKWVTDQSGDDYIDFKR
ncbi:MAG: hypothetical protein H6755_01525 [Candidatus Omnitrophica bacterium]|nr:hypothetical protein [Candidatus Omnitrophota bacterium]MCB9747072.1 hypothetical protein [Candidatus Omnitrophota bacterium]